MHLRPRHASLVAAAALAASTLAMAPAANAVPVFVDADTHLQPYSGAYTYSGSCTTTENSTTSPL